MLLLHSGLVWNDHKITLITSVCGTARLQYNLAIIVRVPQLVHDLSTLATILVTVSLSVLANVRRFNVLVH